MPADPSSKGSTPVIAWLGAAPPPGVTERLAAVARVDREWTPEAQLIAVWAPAGLDQLRRLPRRTRRPPVIAAANHEPTHGERMAWIRAGADDLVSVRALPSAVAQRLLGRPDPPAEGAARPTTPPPMRRRDPTSLVEPVRLPTNSSGQGGERRRTDAFPPLRVPQGEGGIPAAVPPWIEAMQRYLKVRDRWVARVGSDGLDRLLELAHLRAQVPSAVSPEVAHNTFGLAHGTSSAPLGWPILVRRGPSKGKGLEMAQGEVLHAGTDGLVLSVGFESNERQKLVADLTVDEDTNAQFLLEARWQKRASAQRWDVGLLVVEMRLRPLAP